MISESSSFILLVLEVYEAILWYTLFLIAQLYDVVLCIDYWTIKMPLIGAGHQADQSGYSYACVAKPPACVTFVYLCIYILSKFNIFLQTT